MIKKQKMNRLYGVLASYKRSVNDAVTKQITQLNSVLTDGLHEAYEDLDSSWADFFADFSWNDRITIEIYEVMHHIDFPMIVGGFKEKFDFDLRAFFQEALNDNCEDFELIDSWIQFKYNERFWRPIMYGGALL